MIMWPLFRTSYTIVGVGIVGFNSGKLEVFDPRTARNFDLEDRIQGFLPQIEDVC